MSTMPAARSGTFEIGGTTTVDRLGCGTMQEQFERLRAAAA